MQALINKILYKFLKNFVVIYLNDIIIYSTIKKNYVRYIKKIFEVLKNKNLRLKLKNTSNINKKSIF